MSKGANHIPSLDGLRAVSFGIVFVAHAGLDFIVPGGFGVTVLFLSALCAVILIWRCVLVFGFEVHSDRTYLASDTRFDSILFGAALALFTQGALAAALSVGAAYAIDLTVEKPCAALRKRLHA